VGGENSARPSNRRFLIFQVNFIVRLNVRFGPGHYFIQPHGIYSIKNKFAETRKRDPRIIDTLSEACALGTIITLEYSWPVQPNERNFKRLRMYVQVLVNKLEKEFPDFPAVFFPT
jgi:hypothetical protein